MFYRLKVKSQLIQKKLNFSSGDAMSKILALPCREPRTKSKHKTALYY